MAVFRPSGISVFIRQDLVAGASRSGTTLNIDPIITKDGTRVTMAHIGDIGYAKIDAGKSSEEIISFTGMTDNTATYQLTGVVWGYNFHVNTGGVTANQKKHTSGASLIITNDDHFLSSQYVNLDDAQTIPSIKTFSALPAITAGNPVADNDIARKAYVDSVVAGSFPADRLVVAGTAGETIADGDLIYFDTTDDEWKLADADAAGTSENVMLGIAQGAGTDGAAITGGVLLQGVDDAQAGMTIGDVMYLSDTAGDIASSAGTIEVTVGIAKSATELYFSPRFLYFITADQQDALAGSSGTPSSTNLFITADDVSETAVSKVIRRAADGTVSGTLPYYGDGGDGALSATGATALNSVIIDVDASSAAAQAILNVSDESSFSAGDKVFIHQSQGTGAGLWEIATISSTGSTTLIMDANLKNSYAATGAQVMKIPEYTTVDFKTGASLTADAWDGTTGGIAILYASQGVTIEQGVTLSLSEQGFRAAAAYGTQGEGEDGTGSQAVTTANGLGGGGAWGNVGGAGGLHIIDANTSYRTATDNNLIMLFGGAGGGGEGAGDGLGGNGGGILIIISPWIWNAGTITSNGEAGAIGDGGSGGGGGAGGEIWFFSEQILNITTPSVIAGVGGDTSGGDKGGGGGGHALIGSVGVTDDGGAGSVGFYFAGYPQNHLPTS